MGPKSRVPLAMTAYQVSLEGESVTSPSNLTTSVFETGMVVSVTPLAMTSTVETSIHRGAWTLILSLRGRDGEWSVEPMGEPFREKEMKGPPQRTTLWDLIASTSSLMSIRPGAAAFVGK